MDATRPLLPGVNVEEELDALNGLYTECESFLKKWNAYKPYKSEAPADAIIAVLELQREVVARRAYILGLLHQQELPF